MNQYRICIIAPAGYAHSACFLEAAFLLKSALGSLKIPCEMKANELAEDRINILIGCHLLQHGDHLAKFRYIAYQFEQITAPGGPFSENLKQVLKHANAVWDYSRENIAFLKTQGIVAQYVPLGYHQALEQISQAAHKDIDVLFYGSITPGGRRAAILNALMAMKDIRVKTLFGVYGRERDAWIARSRIILNIHHYSSQIFEAVRVSYLLNNKCFVLSETSNDYPYKKVSLPLVPYDNLVESVNQFLAREDEIETLRNQLYEQFKSNYAMEAIVKDAIA
jgi:hypothetical protein